MSPDQRKQNPANRAPRFRIVTTTQHSPQRYVAFFAFPGYRQRGVVLQNRPETPKRLIRVFLVSAQFRKPRGFV